MAVKTTMFRRNPISQGSAIGVAEAADTNRWWSPAIWDKVPYDQIKNGEVDGIAFSDDFESMPLIGTQTTQIGYDKYKVFATAGNAVTPGHSVNSVDTFGGILAFTHGASGESASLAQAYPAFKLSGDKTKDGRLAFEVRIAVKSVLTNRNGFFVGLGETDLFTLATAVPFSSNAGNPTNGGSLLGFHRLGAGTTIIDAAYTDRATSFTNVNTTAGEATMAAFTFTKLGFVYDPTDTVKVIRFFQDNVELASGITPATWKALTNANANCLGLMAATVGGSAVSTDAIYLDWWRCAQLTP